MHKKLIPNTKYQILNTNSGQVLVIVLLVMVVGLTVGLALFSRVTRDIRIASRSTESAQAFAAAEAGVEQALVGSIVAPGGSGTVGTDAHYTVSVTDLGGTINPYPDGPRIVKKGEGFMIWLVNRDSNGALVEVPTYTTNTIDLCFNGGSPNPALLVSLIYKDMPTGLYETLHVGYDPDSGTRNNGFDSNLTTGGNNCGFNMTYRAPIDFTTFGGVASGINPAVDVLIGFRIYPLYQSAQIMIDPNNSTTFPIQGQKIVSTGVVGVINRKIEVYRDFRALSTHFDTVLYSRTGSLEKN